MAHSIITDDLIDSEAYFTYFPTTVDAAWPSSTMDGSSMDPGVALIPSTWQRRSCTTLGLGICADTLVPIWGGLTAWSLLHGVASAMEISKELRVRAAALVHEKPD